MLFYPKWRRIFVRNRVGSILNLKIHHVNLYVIKLPHALAKCCDGVKNCKSLKNDESKLTQLTSQDMMRDRSFAANISIANARIYEKCLPKLDK